MMVAPPMAQVVHTMLAHVLFVPPSLSASSREPSASVASAATVMAVPSAMAKVAATPAQNSPCVSAKTRTRIAPVHGLMPTENTTAITLRQGEHHVSPNMGMGENGRREDNKASDRQSKRQ